MASNIDLANAIQRLRYAAEAACPTGRRWDADIKGSSDLRINGHHSWTIAEVGRPGWPWIAVCQSGLTVRQWIELADPVVGFGVAYLLSVILARIEAGTCDPATRDAARTLADAILRSGPTPDGTGAAEECGYADRDLSSNRPLVCKLPPGHAPGHRFRWADGDTA